MAPNPSKYCTLSGNEHVGANYCSECGAPPLTNTTSDLSTSTNTQLNDVPRRPPPVLPFSYSSAATGRSQAFIPRGSDEREVSLPYINGPKPGRAAGFRGGRAASQQVDRRPTAPLAPPLASVVPVDVEFIIKVSHTVWLEPNNSLSKIRYDAYAPPFECFIAPNVEMTWPELTSRFVRAIQVGPRSTGYYFCWPEWDGRWTIGRGHQQGKQLFTLLEPWYGQKRKISDIVRGWTTGVGHAKNAYAVTMVRTYSERVSLLRNLDI
jgi:hypothetical protein